MSVVLFAGLWLASYRVTRFVLDDTLLARPREALLLRFPPNEEYRRRKRVVLTDGTVAWPTDPTSTRKLSKLGELFDCYWCLGFWLSGAVLALTAQFVGIGQPLLWWPALSTAVALTARNLDGPKD